MEQRRAKSQKRMRRRVMILMAVILLALGYYYAASFLLGKHLKSVSKPLPGIVISPVASAPGNASGTVEKVANQVASDHKEAAQPPAAAVQDAPPQAQAASPGTEAAKVVPDAAVPTLGGKGSWQEVALSPEAPTFPSAIDHLNVKAEVVPPLAEDFILPSKKTVAENREHTKATCEKWLGQRWDAIGKNYRLWDHGFSQFGQDKWLWDVVFGRKRDGVFIDVGAYDGETHSNSAALERCFGWSGILVEANPAKMEILKQWRPKTLIYHAAAGDTNHMCRFLSKQNDELSGLVGESKTSSVAGDVVSDVPCIRLGDLFARHGIHKVNYLSIDTEGVELMVLRTINFDEVDIDVIGVENNGHQALISAFLTSKGYTFERDVGEDIFYFRAGFKPTKFIG